MTTPAAEASKPAPSSKVAVKLHGREYIVACTPGEEHRLAEIVRLVDGKLRQVADKGNNVTETRLFMLTCLLLADELLETRKAIAESQKEDEDLMVAAVDHLRLRVATIAKQVGKA